MYISHLKLINFRNYKEEKVTFTKNTNILIGKNAQGKTNLIESIYYLSRANSFKKIKDNDIIRFGENSSSLFWSYCKEKQKKSYKD
ncbi:AAA family ATPase [Citroniella saccharovorans]|uniref:AAA family ATPase n=1 Tax=Citroniella saccharovorans TaxID=2053367 RepID=A0AAW9MUR5_9FIRM|nr:AAA family ATPase [Citroniella saccharovorans]MEB3428698.1 AAA family ATPase [Citroniella saccharovorans]